MIVDVSQEGCSELLARLRLERDLDPTGQVENHSVGGWQTKHTPIGVGWLGEAMARRLERAGLAAMGSCWATILSPGAEYTPHRHGVGGKRVVAVWCLVGSGELHVGDDVVPDRMGQLVVFPGNRLHWVPRVESERITVAANLSART